MNLSLMNRIIGIGMVTCAIGMFLVGPNAVFAADVLKEGALGRGGEFGKFLDKFGIDANDPTRQPVQPGTVIQRIVAVVFGFLGIIAVVMMIYAGFLWLTARGEEDQAKQGRTLLFQAFIGLCIILAAYSVTYFVLYMLTLSISPTA